MSTTIQTAPLRPAAGCCDSKGLLVPRVSPDNEVISPVRPIYQHKWAGYSLSKGRRNLKWKRYFSAYMRTQFGFSVTDMDILCSRRYDEIKSVILNMESLLDNFMLFDLNFFRRNTSEFRSMIRIVRITIRLTTYSIGDMVSKWKDFVNHFVNLSSKAKVEESVSMKRNPYAFLLKVGKFKEILNKESLSRDDIKSIAHIISSRNLGPGGEQEKVRAYKDFKEITSKPFEVSEGNLHKLYLAAKRIGKICNSLRGTNRLSGGHCSLNSSGTLDVPVSKGGRATDALLDMKKFLNEVPEHGETREYPWGTTYYPPLLERWKAFGPLDGQNGKFLEPTVEEIIDREAMLNGMSEYTGIMLYTVAWEKYSEALRESEAIPVRQITVSEPGGKARIVTTGAWWLAVIQQACCHELREHIAYHPAAHSCMIRADQAWQSLRCFQNLGISSLGTECSVLSSDLKSATDAIPLGVGRTLLRGFLEGVEGTQWEFLSGVIGPRLIIPEGDTPFLLKRGIMMGEPLSKVCLVLLGLAVEEIAFSEYTGQSLKRTLTNSTKWRCFHLGGDDHLAVGPLGYLKAITAKHRTYGSLISPTKHRISKRFVVYTEKILFFDGPILNKKVWQVVQNPDDSIFVDSMKLRLMSPFTKATFSHDEKNIAIGKAKTASSSLEYCDSQYLKRTVINRIRYRFRDFIKGPHHKTISAVISLPTELGGLGLSYDMRYLKALPNIWNRAIRSILKEGSTAVRVQSILGSIFANTSQRGVHFDDYVNGVVDQILEFPGMVGAKTLSELLDSENLGNLSTRRAMHVLRERSWVSLADLPGIAERPYLFRKLLQGKGGRSFKTTPIKNRVASAWDSLTMYSESLNPDDSALSEDELKRAQELSKTLLFVNLNEETTISVVKRGEYDPEDPWISADFREVSLREAIAFGEPSLKVSFTTGLLGKA